MKDDPKQWRQLMDHFQKFACLTNLGDHVREVITYITNYEFTKFQASDAHLVINPLCLHVTILCTQHLVDKLTKKIPY